MMLIFKPNKNCPYVFLCVFKSQYYQHCLYYTNNGIVLNILESRIRHAPDCMTPELRIKTTC